VEGFGRAFAARLLGHIDSPGVLDRIETIRDIDRDDVARGQAAGANQANSHLKQTVGFRFSGFDTVAYDFCIFI
jgi:hypothetical protein